MYNEGKIVILFKLIQATVLYPALRNLELRPSIFLLLATNTTEEEYIWEGALIMFLAKSGDVLRQITYNRALCGSPHRRMPLL